MPSIARLGIWVCPMEGCLVVKLTDWRKDSIVTVSIGKLGVTMFDILPECRKALDGMIHRTLAPGRTCR
jgi:hypothetical protein